MQVSNTQGSQNEDSHVYSYVVFINYITIGSRMDTLKKNFCGYLESETHRECTQCGVIFERTSKMSWCKKCNCTRVKSMSPEWKMHQRAKVRCKKSGLEFTISVNDIVIPDYCPATGIYLNVNSGRSGAYKNSPSLDRIDNDKGYTPDNIQVLSQCANAMKGNAGKEELIAFAKWVLKTHGED